MGSGRIYRSGLAASRLIVTVVTRLQHPHSGLAVGSAKRTGPAPHSGSPSDVFGDRSRFCPNRAHAPSRTLATPTMPQTPGAPTTQTEIAGGDDVRTVLIRPQGHACAHPHPKLQQFRHPRALRRTVPRTRLDRVRHPQRTDVARRRVLPDRDHTQRSQHRNRSCVAPRPLGAHRTHHCGGRDTRRAHRRVGVTASSAPVREALARVKRVGDFYPCCGLPAGAMHANTCPTFQKPPENPAQWSNRR